MMIRKLLIILFGVTAISAMAQRQHISSDKMIFNILDAEYLDSKDGSIIPNITTGFRPFNYYWQGPDNFESTDSILTEVKAGIYYLKIEDALCGKFSDSFEIKSIKEKFVSSDLIRISSVSPNPFSEELRINLFSIEADFCSVRIINSKGNVFYEKDIQLIRGQQDFLIESDWLLPGLYVLQLCMEDRCIQSKKLIKLD